MERQLVEMQSYVGKWIRDTVAEWHRTPFYPDGELTDEMIAIGTTLTRSALCTSCSGNSKSNYRGAVGK